MISVSMGQQIAISTWYHSCHNDIATFQDRPYSHSTANDLPIELLGWCAVLAQSTGLGGDPDAGKSGFRGDPRIGTEKDRGKRRPDVRTGRENGPVPRPPTDQLFCFAFAYVQPACMTGGWPTHVTPAQLRHGLRRQTSPVVKAPTSQQWEAVGFRHDMSGGEARCFVPSGFECGNHIVGREIPIAVPVSSVQSELPSIASSYSPI